MLFSFKFLDYNKNWFNSIGSGDRAPRELSIEEELELKDEEYETRGYWYLSKKCKGLRRQYKQAKNDAELHEEIKNGVGDVRYEEDTR